MREVVGVDIDVDRDCSMAVPFGLASSRLNMCWTESLTTYAPCLSVPFFEKIHARHTDEERSEKHKTKANNLRE
jgi:hypothetical protein